MKQPMKSDKKERLQVVLARFGIASRRAVVTLIEAGKVSVNGKVVLEKGFRVSQANDAISVDGQVLAADVGQEKRYFVLNKPKGVMTTLQDPHAEKTVADFFKDVSARLFPVGRLDRDTTGLLIMTNDGELAFRLTHPKFGVDKKYKARVSGAVSDEKIKHIQKGVLLEEGKTAPCKIEVEIRTNRESILIVTLHEGKKRQIRRIFDRIGHGVTELERLNYGPLSIGNLRVGERRELSAQEVSKLREASGLAPKARVRKKSG